MSLDKHLVLLGMMGSGKSTIAKLISEQCNASLLSLDEMIVEKEGMQISELFTNKAEPYFRDLEAKFLNIALATTKPSVIDCGGGVVDRPSNRDHFLSSDSNRCYLSVPVTLLAARIENAQSRPMLKGEDIAKSLQKLLDKRENLYKDMATIIIEVDDTQSVAQTAKNILAKL